MIQSVSVNHKPATGNTLKAAHEFFGTDVLG